MKPRDLNEIKSWFNSYVKKFYNDDIKVYTNILLKEEHSLRVSTISSQIANSLYLSDNDIHLAEAIGLLHDIGRFEQYKTYKTFKDHLSENHAKLGLKIINENNLLYNIPQNDKKILFDSIGNHNLAALPTSLQGKNLLHAEIVRDADKLDILKIVTDYYKNPKQYPYHSIGENLSRENSINPLILESFLMEERISYTHLKTINDLKITQLGWLFDLNFRYSIMYLYKQNYLDIILSSMKQTREIEIISNKINMFLKSFISDESTKPYI